MLKRLFLFLVSFILVGICSSCSTQNISSIFSTDNQDQPQDDGDLKDSISLEAFTDDKYVGDSFQIKYEAPNNTEKIYWSSSNPSIAIVTDGLVTCLKEGQVTITASCLNDSQSISFPVYKSEDANYYGFKFERNDDGYKVVEYNGMSDIIRIPSEYNGLPVTEIESMDAWYGWSIQATEVYIPNTVTRIDKDAFLNVRNLKYVYVPNLELYNSLHSQIFNGSLQDKIVVFLSCSIPNDFNAHHYNAYLYSYKYIVFIWDSLDGKKVIVNDVLYALCQDSEGHRFWTTADVVNGNYNPIILNQISIDGEQILVEKIPDAFALWSALESIVLPNTISYIGMGAFEGCLTLSGAIYLSRNILFIGSGAFTYSYDVVLFCEPSSRPEGWDEMFAYDGANVIWNAYNQKLVDISDFTYAILKDGSNEEYATIYHYTGKEKDLVLPKSIIVDRKDIPVKGIARYAFVGNSSIKILTIPSSILFIDSAAFVNVSSLEQIFAESISRPTGWESSYLDDRVLFGFKERVKTDNGFECAVFQNEHNQIFAALFDYTGSADNVTIPSIIETDDHEITISTIMPQTFSNCTSVKQIKIPDTIKEIKNKAFNGCRSLKTVYIPNSITTTGDYSFAGCTSLTTVFFEDNSKLQSIGQNAFDGCNSLTSITIPASVSSLDCLSFSDCTNLTSVIFEENSNLTNIVGSAFNGCNSLTSIVIPKGVTNIGQYAFEECASLTSIIIPKSVTNIGQEAFAGCDNLTIYCEASSQPSGWASNWNSICPVVWGYQGN